VQKTISDDGIRSTDAAVVADGSPSLPSAASPSRPLAFSSPAGVQLTSGRCGADAGAPKTITTEGAAVHELGITQGIIDRAREAAAGAGAEKVTDLFLVTTPAADFTEDSIEMYFEMLTQDDPVFAGATLHFDRRPVAATCLRCSDEFTTVAAHPVCPQCGSLEVRFDPEAPMVQLTDIGVDEE
jgi:Zn finger protein HypA/HybF involved in hydrogenase expression